MADKKPLIPPLTLTDSLDKPNPGSIQPIQHWERSIVPAIVTYALLLVFFVLFTIFWITRQPYIGMTPQEITNSYIVGGILFAVDGILLYGLFGAMRFIHNKAQRETLINLSEHQATIQHLTDQLNHTMMLQEQYMLVLNERAQKSMYQGVLALQDSHDYQKNDTDAKTYHAPPDEAEQAAAHRIASTFGQQSHENEL